MTSYQEGVLSLSYGKDSLACLGAIEKLGLPLTRIIHAEIWATETISADLPPMVEFKKKADEIIKAWWGIEVEHVCAMKDGKKLTYQDIFYRRLKPRNQSINQSSNCARCTDSRRGKDNGAPAYSNKEFSTKIYGFPYSGRGFGWCHELKISILRFSALSNRKLVHPTQTEGFLTAPLHKGRRKILCSTLESQLTSPNVSRDMRIATALCYHLCLRAGTKLIVGSGARKTTFCHPFMQQQRAAAVGFVIIKVSGNFAFCERIIPICGRCF